ncbi:TrkA C-terminal domain-containing protein [Halococcus salifodinae]|nr:TrkA C-terminal domain-containing protein [Halococcus salifodinae]
MVALYPILSLLIVFALSALIVRIGSIAFRMTGMSSDVASFQAASAYSGAGFTTDEAEVITESLGRRKIAQRLIRLGSVGIISGIASLTLSFTGSGNNNIGTIALIVGGAVVVYLFARSRWVERVTTPLIERTLARTTDLRLRDYTQVLGLRNGYRIAEIDVDAEDWLTAGSIAELDLPAEGVLPLAVERADGTYIGAPGPDVEKEPGDTLVLFGQEDRLQELSDRHETDTQAREDAVEDHQDRLEARVINLHDRGSRIVLSNANETRPYRFRPSATGWGELCD